MRFRRIEKDALGASTEIMQGKEDDVSTSESKTYIGSNTKKKVDMNKIKNTKLGDDIHYYVNGIEGRGIVVKMGSQYIDLFQQDGNVTTVNINDTFFVKDILVNKQWDDMDDTEKYESLQKIHAPTPRFITKSWSALPVEIQDLLIKDGMKHFGVDKKKANLDKTKKPEDKTWAEIEHEIHVALEERDPWKIGTVGPKPYANPMEDPDYGPQQGEKPVDVSEAEKKFLESKKRKDKAEGHTYEEGETKDSETQDHARTGFAQNAQYKKKVEYDDEGRPYIKINPETKKPYRWIDPDTGKEDVREHSYRHDRDEEDAESLKKDPNYNPVSHPRHPDYYDRKKNPYWDSRVEDKDAPGKFREPNKPDGTRGNIAVSHKDDESTNPKYKKVFKPWDHAEVRKRNSRQNKVKKQHGLTDENAKDHPAYQAAHEANEKEYSTYKEKRKRWNTPEGRKVAAGRAKVRRRRAEEDKQEQESWEKQMGSLTGIDAMKPGDTDVKTPASDKLLRDLGVGDLGSRHKQTLPKDVDKAYSVWLQRRKAYIGEQ